jgi:hypothetical protein
VLHLLRRATFGPTPALLAEVRAAGTTAWLDAQLAPLTKVPDTAMDAMMSRWPRLGWKTWEVRERLTQFGSWDVMYDLLEAHLARALFSRRQVFETAVDFWTNHLVVPVPSSEVWDSAHLGKQSGCRAEGRPPEEVQHGIGRRHRGGQCRGRRQGGRGRGARCGGHRQDGSAAEAREHATAPGRGGGVCGHAEDGT